MYIKIILNFLLLIIILGLQLSFVSGLPDIFKDINLFLIALVFFLGFKGVKEAMIWAMIFGLITDLYSFHPFGIYVICFISLVILLNFLLANFFTNRSLYSYFALILFGTIFFEITIRLLNFLISSIFKINLESNYSLAILYAELKMLIINLSITYILFNLINYISKKWQPVFLTKINSK